MKQIWILIVLIIILVAVSRCSSNSELSPQRKVSDFSILADMSTVSSVPEYRTQVFVDSNKRVRIIKPHQYPTSGNMVTWDTKSASLDETELQEFYDLLGQIDIFALPAAYTCKAVSLGECYVNEPVLQSAGIAYLKFEINGRQKEIRINTSNETSEVLREIMRRMVGIRDKFSLLPWVEKTSTYSNLFK
ncbi:hypothetical protein KKE14_00105 [Patescibacteria group bacterium]|nr:hypothetical protein [Patescibacteria group bacterium]